uniref:Sulfatase N-terminal domain-containing protein n=1 Tax=Plectus sambesii TaxID=2011161 RepID=A0A914VN18_9BILA
MNCKQKTEDRRLLCGMVNAVDTAVGDVVQYLKANGLYDNTIIIFSSDNGGAVDFGGNNWPLRGAKFTLWEGGTRTHGFVHAPQHVQKHAVREDLFHVVDWYATIMAMASGESDIDQYGDGYNQWDMITKGTKGKRNSVVYNYAQ